MYRNLFIFWVRYGKSRWKITEYDWENKGEWEKIRKCSQQRQIAEEKEKKKEKVILIKIYEEQECS